MLTVLRLSFYGSLFVWTLSRCDIISCLFLKLEDIGANVVIQLYSLKNISANILKKNSSPSYHYEWQLYKPKQLLCWEYSSATKPWKTINTTTMQHGNIHNTSSK
ncbi:TPA: hypothetical protein GDO54_018626 [Pyxicephalus adspersus]|uniref:Secreted protein n=1 Tax=Pyxicephalus adspersus TaxID=30357 RepID=A0AAV2ZJ63_PYXAD|nr:TPA: hypothetical protein GDO54_018626 [Pyxicephalus adspersus]